MAAAILLRFMDVSPSVNPSDGDVRAEFGVGGQGVAEALTVTIIITIGAGDTPQSIRVKLTTAIISQAAALGITLVAANVLLPDLSKGALL